MNGALAITDLSMVADEPRVQDLRLAERLGFKRPRVVRELIERNLEELEMHGSSAVRHGAYRGRPTTEYWLNEAQALLVCMFARTPGAAAIRREVIEVFLAWRRGEMPPAAPMTERLTVARRKAEDLAATVQALEAARGGMVINLSTAPIWKSGRRPPWWADMEVREFMIITHRQMGTLEAEAAGLARFGEARMPKKSAINSFWQKLDALIWRDDR